MPGPPVVEAATIQRPPGPRGGELGMAMRFRKQPVDFFYDVVHNHGNICSFKVGSRWFYVVNEPEVVFDLLVTNNAKFVKDRSQRLTHLLLGQGLITSEGELHLKQRRLMQPYLHRNRVDEYGPSIVRYTEQATHAWADGATIDLHHELNRVTLDIITETLFDNLVGEAGRSLSSELGNMMSYVIRVVTSPLPTLTRWWPGPKSVKARLQRRKLNQLIFKIIDEARERHRQGQHDTLLDGLLDAEATPERPGIPTQQIHDEVITLLLTGHETTANALSWGWHLLSLHPTEYERMLDEVDALLLPRESKPGARDAVSTLTAADVEQLPYTRRVMTEAMRLFPPAYVIGREAVEDHRVGDYEVPKGTTVFMSQYVMHRDERYYEDPDRFDPDRWLPERSVGRPKWAYFPFGGGPRGCIGEPFSWLEGVLMLAGLSHVWRFHAAPDKPAPVAQPLISLRPRDGVWMVAEDRRK
jgi:cytochrome P450